MASAESVAAVIEAGGAHVPELMERLEARLAELARSHGADAGRARGGDDRRRRQAAAAAARVRRRRAATARPRHRCCAPRWPWSWCTRPRSCTTTSSTPRRCAAAGRRSSPRRAARWRRRPATCCSRARSPSWRAAEARRRCGCSRTRPRRSRAGELLQREDAWDAGITRERYDRRCDLKTARLFEAACRLGALGGAGEADLLGRFGRSIGLAFQLLDDVLDVTGPAERTGKHRGTDLLDGTVTLPLILARERDEQLAALDLRSVRTAADAERVCDAIAATGALEALARGGAGDGRRRQGGAAGAARGPAGSARAGGRRRRRPVFLKSRAPARGPRSPRAGSRRRSGRGRSGRSRPPCWPGSGA